MFSVAVDLCRTYTFSFAVNLCQYRGAPPACMLEPKDTSGESFDQKFSTLRSTMECMSDSELILLLKKKTSPICYVWCDPSPWMHITQVQLELRYLSVYDIFS
jgi:hypothetical protein